MQLGAEATSAAADWLFHGTDTVAILVVCYYVIRRLNRDESLRQDYPPHRHINGTIVYPREYEPAQLGHLPVVKGHE